MTWAICTGRLISYSVGWCNRRFVRSHHARYRGHRTICEKHLTLEALEKLLAFDPALRRSRFARLRGYAESPVPTNLLALIDRLEYVRGLGLRKGGVGHAPIVIVGDITASTKKLRFTPSVTPRIVDCKIRSWVH